METVILAIHVVIAVSLVGLILIQQGKGADAGAAFGSGGGASGTVFGSQGSGNFLTKTTALLATLFFLTSIFLSYLSGKISSDKAAEIEDMNKVEQKEIQDKPALPMTAVPVKESSDKPAVPVE